MTPKTQATTSPSITTTTTTTTQPVSHPAKDANADADLARPTEHSPLLLLVLGRRNVTQDEKEGSSAHSASAPSAPCASHILLLRRRRMQIVSLLLLLLLLWIVVYVFVMIVSSSSSTTFIVGISRSAVAEAELVSKKKSSSLMERSSSHRHRASSSLGTHPPVVQSRPGFPSYLDYNGGNHHNVNQNTNGTVKNPGPDPKIIRLTYDNRSVLLNGERALFLSGSVHPYRSTRDSFQRALHHAVAQHLNMITLYVLWNVHEPFPQQPMNWNLLIPSFPPTQQNTQPSNWNWTLADAIQMAAAHGLFVHVRIGPYVCAEVSYGGIPEWLPLQLYHHQNNHRRRVMNMRRLNVAWMHAMQNYVHTVMVYLASHQLWADQGGPIVLAQIENELQVPIKSKANATKATTATHRSMRRMVEEEEWISGQIQLQKQQSLQQYANWCGKLVQRLAPHGIWTMCNGLSAPNTINTFNGDWNAASWLQMLGDNGRIQVDQPALWTENEGGFQVWGDESSRPSDYYWGRSASDMAHQTLRWFARGGSHVNYYMWYGGSNFGRLAAGGIMNMYANDAMLCSSGERHQPKFDHLNDMHAVLIEAADILLHAPTALHQNHTVQVQLSNHTWTNISNTNQDLKLFRYLAAADSRTTDDTSLQDSTSISPLLRQREVVFVENDGNQYHRIRFDVLMSVFEESESGMTSKPLVDPRNLQQAPSHLQQHRSVIMDISPYTTLLLIHGQLMFNSSNISESSLSYQRRMVYDPVPLFDVDAFVEPIGGGSAVDSSMSRLSSRPVEQTELIVQAAMLTDYVWYQVNFTLHSSFWDLNTNSVSDNDVRSSVECNNSSTTASLSVQGMCMSLEIETQQANGMVVYLDDKYIGSADTHHHSEGNVTLVVSIPSDVVAHLLLQMRGGVPTRRNCSREYTEAWHTLSILSESFGNGNLIGAFQVKNTGRKTKGITGAVRLTVEDAFFRKRRVMNLVDHDDEDFQYRHSIHHVWRSTPGLAGEVLLTMSSLVGRGDSTHSNLEEWRQSLKQEKVKGAGVGGLWTLAYFETPEYDASFQSLFLEISSGRGHVWLNGMDLGRYWNITRGNTTDYSQRYYFLPADLLRPTLQSSIPILDSSQHQRSNCNQILWFDAFATLPNSNQSGVDTNPRRIRNRLVLSWIEPAASKNFEDRVDFGDACLS